MLSDAFQGDVSGGYSLCFITSGTSPHSGLGPDQTVSGNQIRCRDSICLVSLAQCLMPSGAHRVIVEGTNTPLEGQPQGGTRGPSGAEGHLSTPCDFSGLGVGRAATMTTYLVSEGLN